jgi:hypothetical protein
MTRIEWQTCVHPNSKGVSFPRIVEQPHERSDSGNGDLDFRPTESLRCTYSISKGDGAIQLGY